MIVDRSADCGRPTLFLLAKMHEPIRHRGPDGEGFALVDERGGTGATTIDALRTPTKPCTVMGFRRLKIIDLSDSAGQPMGSEDGAVWLVFNGEIYNYRQLRHELVGLGRRFRTRSDTEVVLAAYEQWGEDCFRRFEGMWAIVLADYRERRIVASRDRFGIKPLFWSVVGDRLFLASEAKQIIRTLSSRPRAHAPLVRMYAEGGRYPCLEETFFEEIRAVPPATWFAIPLTGPHAPVPEFRTYWTLAEREAPESFEAARLRLRAALDQAVDSHRVADVTVGSLLSGGLDSGVVASLLVPMQQRAGIVTPTFSLGFRDAAPEACELRYVDALVRRNGWHNHETSFDSRWVLDNIRRCVYSLEEPPLAMAALAQYRVFQLCRDRDATVVLDGQGADEILGGYPFYQRLILIDHFRERRWRDLTGEVLHLARESGARRAFEDAMVPILKKLRNGRPLAPVWIESKYGARQDLDEVARVWSERDAFSTSRLSRQLFLDVKWGNVKIVLGYADRNAMAFSVEARVPYFDREVVELAFSLPDAWKVGRGKRKRILREVAADLLPPEILHRRDRMGFGTPDKEMIRGPLLDSIRASVLDPGFLELPLFRASALRSFLDEYERGEHDDHRTLWRLWSLANWANVYDVAFS